MQEKSDIPEQVPLASLTHASKHAGGGVLWATAGPTIAVAVAMVLNFIVKRTSRVEYKTSEWFYNGNKGNLKTSEGSNLCIYNFFISPSP